MDLIVISILCIGAISLFGSGVALAAKKLENSERISIAHFASLALLGLLSASGLAVLVFQ